MSEEPLTVRQIIEEALEDRLSMAYEYGVATREEGEATHVEALRALAAKLRERQP